MALKTAFQTGWKQLANYVLPLNTIFLLLVGLAAFYIVWQVAFKIRPVVDEFNATMSESQELMDHSLQATERSLRLSNDAMQISEKVGEVAVELQRRIDEISEDVNRLTTDEINRRLTQVDVDLRELTTQLDLLKKVISPENVQDILSVARMADEIQARERFEKAIKTSLGSYERKLERTDTTVADIQFWIWGGLITIIVTLFGTVAYLLRILHARKI